MWLIQKIYNIFVPTFVKRKWRSYKSRRQNRNTTSYVIRKAFECGINVYHIKDESWEYVHMPEIFHIMKSWENRSYHPAQNICRVQNADVRVATDIITLNDSCIWDKSEFDIFSKIVPLDKGLIDYSQSQVRLYNPTQIIPINGSCISLCGVHAKIWTHFIIQFLPKLYYAAEAGIFDEDNITVLMPNYTDANIIELIDMALLKYPNVRRFVCEDNPMVAYRCEYLYHIPSASVSTNHANYILPYDVVIPKSVIDILQENVVAPLTKSLNSCKKKKLYLVRRSMVRGLRNYEEVERFFEQKGFVFVEPHKLSLQEKAELFYNAEIIAGPASGAWTNVIFCHQARGLFLNTMCRTIDSYSKYLQQLGNVKVLQVTGWDFSTSSIHSDFHIPLEKIEAAYKQLIQ